MRLKIQRLRQNKRGNVSRGRKGWCSKQARVKVQAPCEGRVKEAKDGLGDSSLRRAVQLRGEAAD